MKTRCYGIDIFKCISMYMIIILHILGVGGILDAADPGSVKYYIAWLFEGANICAVNCFGLASGYVQCRGHYRRSRLLSLWLRVVLEGLIITGIFFIVMPEIVGVKEWLNAVMPVIHDVYWYFTAYFALFFFIPYINKMLAQLSDRAMAVMCGSIVILLCFVGNIKGIDIFHIQGGYSFLWLLSLYLLGAGMRRLEIRPQINKFWFLLGFAGCVLLSCLMHFLNILDVLLNYSSPLNVLAAACLLLFFRRINVSSKRGIKLISTMTRTSFGVYIIHTQPLVWTYFLMGRFTGFLSYSAPIFFLMVLASAAGIYIAGSAGDWLCEKFMKLCRIDLLEKAVDGIGKTNEQNDVNNTKIELK